MVAHFGSVFPSVNAVKSAQAKLWSTRNEMEKRKIPRQRATSNWRHFALEHEDLMCGGALEPWRSHQASNNHH